MSGPPPDRSAHQRGAAHNEGNATPRARGLRADDPPPLRVRVLVACVGNVLRGDDGFGVAVAHLLAAESALPAGVEVIETGIGGLSIVHQLMDGYDALIVVDAVEQGAAPGTLFVLEPSVPEPASLPTPEWQAQFSNLHLAEPSRALLLARAAGVLPPRVALVGCQPAACEDYAEGLSPPVAAAIALAARKVRELTAVYTASAESL